MATVPGQTRIFITDVGLRDGLQLEKRILPTRDKIDLGLKLIEAGIVELEATSFVSRTAVPQLADATEVVAGLRGKGARISALAPNPRGCREAVQAGVDAVTAFASASESHNQKNLNRSVEETLARLPAMATECAGKAEFTGAISTAFGCPFEGDIDAGKVARVVSAFAQAGITRISLGDTTGMASPPVVRRLLRELNSRFPEISFIMHFHNTRGLALANALIALEMGAVRFESSIGGLGGCPFAPGATGNVSTEDLVHLLDELDAQTGISLEKLLQTSSWLEEKVGRRLESAVAKSGSRSRRYSINDGPAAKSARTALVDVTGNPTEHSV